jgi:predicted DCC family thiol-disulfide oxidoreductase YuxK
MAGNRKIVRTQTTATTAISHPMRPDFIDNDNYIAGSDLAFSRPGATEPGREELRPMTELVLQALAPARGEHLILYDGVCGLCNRLNQFVLLRDTRAVFDFASLQSPTARSILPRLGGNAESLDTVYVVVNYRSGSPVLLSKSGAASFVLKTLGIRGPLSWAFRVLPDGLLNLGYDLIARNRYRVFGRAETCMMPSAEFQKRFIDI